MADACARLCVGATRDRILGCGLSWRNGASAGWSPDRNNTGDCRSARSHGWSARTDRFVGFILASRRAAIPALNVTTSDQSRILRRAARIVIIVGAVLMVFGSFGLASFATERPGTWLIRLTLDIGLVVLIAYVLREITVAWINRQLARENPLGTLAATATAPEMATASRLKTILPLVQRALQVAISRSPR